MKKFKVACTTRAGQYIETEIAAKNMLDLIQPLVYQLAVEHRTAIDDLVELDITELPQ